MTNSQNKGAINVFHQAQGQMRMEHEREAKDKTLAEAQAEHDKAMKENPDQAKALQALDMMKVNVGLNLDEQIKQTETLLAELKQKRDAMRVETVKEVEVEEDDASDEREIKESNQSKHSAGGKRR